MNKLINNIINKPEGQLIKHCQLYQIGLLS